MARNSTIMSSNAKVGVDIGRGSSQAPKRNLLSLSSFFLSSSEATTSARGDGSQCSGLHNFVVITGGLHDKFVIQGSRYLVIQRFCVLLF